MKFYKDEEQGLPRSPVSLCPKIGYLQTSSVLILSGALIYFEVFTLDISVRFAEGRHKNKDHFKVRLKA